MHRSARRSNRCRRTRLRTASASNRHTRACTFRRRRLRRDHNSHRTHRSGPRSSRCRRTSHRIASCLHHNCSHTRLRCRARRRRKANHTRRNDRGWSRWSHTRRHRGFRPHGTSQCIHPTRRPRRPRTTFHTLRNAKGSTSCRRRRSHTPSAYCRRRFVHTRPRCRPDLQRSFARMLRSWTRPPRRRRSAPHKTPAPWGIHRRRRPPAPRPRIQPPRHPASFSACLTPLANRGLIVQGTIRRRRIFPRTTKSHGRARDTTRPADDEADRTRPWRTERSFEVRSGDA